jgi:hypothetical protein
MAYNLEKHPPNTIILSGREHAVIINDLPIVDVGAKPGHFVELYLAAGNVVAWRRHSDAARQLSSFILVEQDIQNLGVDAPYNSGDNAIVAAIKPGMTLWPIIPSGQTINGADFLQSNGDGRLKEASAVTAAANVARLQALETLGVVTTDTRCRVQVI